MKIIHCADVHLGSKLGRLSREKAEQRASEICATFCRMIDFARGEGITNILLAGDVFDSDRPFKKDKDFFYSTVKNSKDITFYYLRGNHDGKQSYVEEIENLKTFGESWTHYGLDKNVTLSGIEITADNCNSMYSSLNLSSEKFNIVMLHGAAGSESGVCQVNIDKLRNKHIDYLALGHYHECGGDKIDERGEYLYCGCLEGRGFDEIGKKGFIVYDTERKHITFIPFSWRTVDKIDVDITGAHDRVEAKEKVVQKLAEQKINRENLLRVNLVGEIDFVDETIENFIENSLGGACYCMSVNNASRLVVDYYKYLDSLSLKGEFVRVALRAELGDEDRQAVLNLGLKALSGDKER